MLNRTQCFLFLFVCVLSSCVPHPTLQSDVTDSKSKLLTVLMQKTDFDIEADWSAEGISQRYETPSADNHGLIESCSRQLIGTINNNPLFLINHRLFRYNNKVDWMEPINLVPEEDDHSVNVVFSTLGESMHYQCYSNAVLLKCQIIVQYDTIFSKLDFQTVQSLLENDRVEFINSVLLKIDARVSKYK